MTHTHSLWLDTAEQPRFAPLDRDAEYDVAVVGAGITGLTAAYHLKKAGKRVAVLEQARLGASNTGYTTGHLCTTLDVGYITLLKRHGKETARAIASGVNEAVDDVFRIADDIGVPEAVQRVPGYLIAEKESDRALIARQYDACREAGVAVRPDAPQGLPFPLADGFQVENQGQLHAGLYLAALARYVHDATAEGSHIYEHTRMTRVAEGQPLTVKTERGTIRARDAVILATHTPPGIHAVHGFLEPMRSYVLAVALEQPVPAGLYWTTATPYEYLRSFQLESGEEILIVGGADTKTGTGHEDDAYRKLERWTRERFAVKDVRWRWSNQFYEPADGLPIIGTTLFHKHIHLATGYSGDGLPLGTLAARMISEDIQGHTHKLANVFKPTRFNLTGAAKGAALQFGVAKHWFTDRLRAAHVAGVEKLGLGEGAVFKVRNKRLAIYRDETGRLHALEAGCTHLRCTVHFNDFERTWDCPCHGSRFDIHGTVLQGPATRPLRAVEVEPVPAMKEKDV